jgi:hypothetical protein
MHSAGFNAVAQPIALVVEVPWRRPDHRFEAVLGEHFPGLEGTVFYEFAPPLLPEFVAGDHGWKEEVNSEQGAGRNAG